MDITALEEIGLTKGEITTYLTLLSLGSVKVGRIIEKSGLQSSVVHNCLNKLIEKGLVKYIKVGKIRHYSAVDPKLLLDFIEEKKKDVQEIIPELVAKQKKETIEEAEVFRGFKGVTTMIHQVTKESKKGGEGLFFSYDIEEYTKEVQDFYQRTEVDRAKKGITVRGIARPELKKFFGKRSIVKNIRYTQIPIPHGISIYPATNVIFFLSWGKKPVGFLIRSEELAKRYKEYFYKVWKLAKK